MQNIETLNTVFEGVEQSKRKIVVTCAHCFNALGNEYPQVGGDYEVVHHTQLLNRLVRQKKLIPVSSVSEDVTYHDPCYLGRHNKVYDAPRELMAASGSNLKEMPRHGERSMCCGAGGARMWMEENIGKRINIDRVDEALATNPKKIATGCPFCRVMLTDGVTARQEGGAHEGVEVVDVAQLMLESITRVEASTLAENIKVIPRERSPQENLVAEETAEVEEAERIEPVEEPVEAKSAPAAPAPKAGGLKMKGLAKPPGAKAPAAAAPEKAAESEPAGAPAAKPKGLGLAGGAKAPGGKGLQLKGKAPGAKAAGSAAPAEAPAAAPADATVDSSADVTATESTPTVKPKGLAVKSGFKKPGAKAPGKPSAPATQTPAFEAPAAETTASEAPAAEAPTAATETKPTVKPKGLAVKSGFKKPGAKAPGKPAETSAPVDAAPAEAPDAAPAVSEATGNENSDEANGAGAPTPPKPKAGGLGFAPGTKVPGRKK